MPKFRLNKLVRDKFVDEYRRSNQIATYRKLSKEEYARQLILKIKEELSEIETNDTLDKMASEIADVQQALNDLARLYDLSEEKINSEMKKKFDKKGGFSDGLFVETLELADDDEWVKYYRDQPDIFPEVK